MPLTVSCSSKSILVLPFWYRLTRAVPDKVPLNGCSSNFYFNIISQTPPLLKCVASLPREIFMSENSDMEYLNCDLMTRCGWSYDYYFSTNLLQSALKGFLKINASVLWHCWLGSRKGIEPVKNWVVGCWHGYLYGARCRFAYGPADAIATHYLLL